MVTRLRIRRFCLSGFESGAVLALSGSSAFELENGNIVPAAAGGPDAGDYELQLEVTHADLLGTVTLDCDGEYCEGGVGDEGSYGLAGLTPESAVAVAAGYVGSVYAVALVGGGDGWGYSVAG